MSKYYKDIMMCPKNDLVLGEGPKLCFEDHDTFNMSVDEHHLSGGDNPSMSSDNNFDIRPPGDFGLSRVYEDRINNLSQRVAYLETVVYGFLNENRQKHQSIDKADLDCLCGGLFITNPSPSDHQFSVLARSLKDSNPLMDEKQIKSVAKRWFRKKREEIGLKIINAIKRTCPDPKDGKRLIRLQLESGQFDFDELLRVAKLSEFNSEAIKLFCKTKIEIFLSKVK